MQRQRQTILYLSIINILCGFILFSNVTKIITENPQNLLMYLLIIMINLFALIKYVDLPGEGLRISVSFEIIYAALIIFGTPAAVLMNFFSLLIFDLCDILKIFFSTDKNKIEKTKERLWGIFVNPAKGAISLFLCGYVYDAISHRSKLFTTPESFLAVILSIGVFAIFDPLLVFEYTALRTVRPKGREKNYTVIDVIQSANYRPLVFEYLISAFFALNAAVLYYINPFYTLLVIPQVVLTYLALKHYRMIYDIVVSMIDLLVQSNESYDYITGIHVAGVSELSKKMAQRLNIPYILARKIFRAAVVHDIGKIGIPDSILCKDGKLTDEEFQKMQSHTTHPIIKALAKLKFFEGIEAIVRGHHEKWNGKGYPDHLQGESIPLGARVVAIADVWHALVSKRQYKKPKTFALALEIMLEELRDKKSFDPKIFVIFLEVLSDTVDEIKSHCGLPIEAQTVENYKKILSDEIEELITDAKQYPEFNLAAVERLRELLKEAIEKAKQYNEEA